MGPIEHIRRHILDVSQLQLSQIVGKAQSTVSRWERGELQPDAESMRAIREAAMQRGIEWSDSFFFEVPAVEARTS